MSDRKVIQFPQVLQSQSQLKSTEKPQRTFEQDKQHIIDYIVPIAIDVFKLIRRKEPTHNDVQLFLDGFMDCFIQIDKGELQLDNINYPETFAEYTEAVEWAYMELSRQGKAVSVSYCLGFVYYIVYVCEG